MSLPSRLAHRCFAVLLALLASTCVAQKSYTTVVVFGDSLSDTGNIAHLTQSQYGIRYPSDLPPLGVDYTDGRFTDGPDTQPAAKAYTGVWVEQLASAFGATVSVKNSLDGGTNYAYGDATTGAGTTVESRTYLGQTLSITLNNMGQQVSDYLATHPQPNAQTLYVLWGGSNDLFNAASSGQDPVAAAQVAVTNEINLVKQLAAAGATNFVIPNVPPLGVFAASKGTAAVDALNMASGVFAQGLQLGLAQVQAAGMGTLTFYQPDIFGLFQTVATKPMTYALGNITTPAQNITQSPDTYLIWDGLHPTTTGHHLVASVAANLIATLATSTTTLSAPAAAVVGAPVTVTVTVTSSKSGNVPSGLVTLFDGTTAVGSGTLDGKGTTQITLTPAEAAGSNAALTAVYAGDIANGASSSQVATLGVLSTAVVTTTTLTSSTSSAGVGAALTFTAQVSASTASYGSPSGTVSFLDGSTSIGSGALSNGTATFTTSTLTAGTHQITAVYAANGVFGGSTSAVLAQVVAEPSFTPTASPTSVTVQRGNSGTVSLTAISVGGFSGTLTLSCGTLPAHLSCSFQSPTITVATGTTGSPNADTLTISTSGASSSAAAAIPQRPGAKTTGGAWMAVLLLPGTFGLLSWKRRRHSLKWLQLSVALVGCVAGLAGLAGCGDSNSAAPGTYTVPVVFTPAATSGTAPAAQTLNVTVTVQ